MIKFNVKIGKREDFKGIARVEWSGEKKAGEIKIRYENKQSFSSNGQKIFLVGLGAAFAQGLGGPSEELTVGELQKVGAKLVKRIKEEEIKNLALTCPETGLNPETSFTEALVLGFLLGSYEFKKYKTKDDNLGKMGELGEMEITFLVKNSKELVKVKEEITKAEIYSQATCLARDLVNEPSSVTTPSYLADLAMKLGKKHGFFCKVYGEKELKQLGMGCLLGVAKGSDEEPKFIKIEHKPEKYSSNEVRSSRFRSNNNKQGFSKGKTVVLVGKGVTFDSGGLSLKTGDGMETMKMDMAGAASILAIFSVLDIIKPKRFNVIGLIPLTENMPSGKAIKPGDVLKSFSGKTVEVLNTDAEGRLILADALSYGITLKPDLMIDLATLTGACITALGEDIAGLFTNDEKKGELLQKAAKVSGEKIWPMPLEQDYKELLKSEVADLKNVTGNHGKAGAITAALFLQEFVGQTPWIHLDIAGPAWSEKGTELTPKGGTGFGVRTILNFLENYRE